jgi:acetoin utilization protein AcuB
MLVAKWMSTKLITIGSDESMSRAAQLMKDYRIGHLPVIRDGKLVGIVSDRDLKRASASDATALEVHELSYLLSQVKVGSIMTSEPVTVSEHDSIDEAALIMLENKISALPVVDDQGEVIAMLTQGDIFRALVLLTGVTKGGIQFALDLPDEPGSIRKAADCIRMYGGRMVSILTSYERVAEGRRRVYLRMEDIDYDQLPRLQEDLSRIGRLLYVVDRMKKTDEKEMDTVKPRWLNQARQSSQQNQPGLKT